MRFFSFSIDFRCANTVISRERLHTHLLKRPCANFHIRTGGVGEFGLMYMELEAESGDVVLAEILAEVRAAYPSAVCITPITALVAHPRPATLDELERVVDAVFEDSALRAVLTERVETYLLDKARKSQRYVSTGIEGYRNGFRSAERGAEVLSQWLNERFSLAPGSPSFEVVIDRFSAGETIGLKICPTDWPDEAQAPSRLV